MPPFTMAPPQPQRPRPVPMSQPFNPAVPLPVAVPPVLQGAPGVASTPGLGAPGAVAPAIQGGPRPMGGPGNIIAGQMLGRPHPGVAMGRGPLQPPRTIAGLRPPRRMMGPSLTGAGWRPGG